MTNNPVSQFEEALRRATRRKGSDDQIKEVASHYDDLYNEALNKGASVEEARKHADEHIGDVAEIAKEIRSGDGKSNGFKLQWIAMGLLFFGAFLPRFIDHGYVIGSLWGRIVEATYPIGIAMTALAGILTAVGIYRAKSISVAAICIGILAIPIGHFAFLVSSFHSLSRYETVMNKHTDASKARQALAKPQLLHRYALVERCLSKIDPEAGSAIEELSSELRDHKSTGIILIWPTKYKYFYPVSTRNVGQMPFINMTSTDSLSQAKNAWLRAENVRKSMPSLRGEADQYFKFFASLDHISAPEEIARASWFGLSPGAYSFLASLLLIGISTSLAKLARRRRRVL